LTVILAVLPILALSTLIDRIGYGRWLLSAYNFADFNVFAGGSAHFGVNPWYWYIVNIPAIFTVHLVPIFAGVYASKHGALLALSVWFVVVHSALAHKEHRFLLTIVPLLCIYAGEYLAKLRRSAPSMCTRLVIFMTIVNVPIAVYTGLVHQRGVIGVTDWLVAASNKSAPMTIWFLMPCHSTPSYSHFHSIDVHLRALDCSPNLHHIDAYIDEADRFHADPERWLRAELLTTTVPSPTHIVMYESMFDGDLRRALVNDEVDGRHYRPCARLLNSHFPVGSRQSTHIVVICIK
jgi:hypothetical protein